MALILTMVLVGKAAPLAATEISSPPVKAREGSLVLDSENKEPGTPPKKDLLHTMLSREVQVYIFRGATRVFPQPLPWGRVQYYQPSPRLKKLAGPYLESLIQKYAQRHGVDPALVRAVMRHESGFDPYAVSPKGAQGLMQLMPGTAALMGVSNPFDPEQNIAGGVGYLRHCLDQFGHNVPLAVAAYNAGPARVAKSQGVPAIPETQAFVKNVLGSYNGGAVPGPEAKPTHQPKAKMATGSPHPAKILPAAPKAPVSPASADKPATRPRPKIIVVQYPRAKQIAAAKPQEAD
ncbi:MAG: lytic transglycosylase domain-containing protein [Desulfobaccales bacterium]